MYERNEPQSYHPKEKVAKHKREKRKEKPLQYIWYKRKREKYEREKKTEYGKIIRKEEKPLESIV